jgi:hypothetical protein
MQMDACPRAGKAGMAEGTGAAPRTTSSENLTARTREPAWSRACRIRESSRCGGLARALVSVSGLRHLAYAQFARF